MPTEEKKAEYNENKKKKRRKDRFEAMPEAQALRAELSGLQRSMAGEWVYMGSADYESELRGRAEMWKGSYEELQAPPILATDGSPGATFFRCWSPATLRLWPRTSARRTGELSGCA